MERLPIPPAEHDGSRLADAVLPEPVPGAWRGKLRRVAPADVTTSAQRWSTIAALALVGALAVLLAFGEVRVFQADSYKALYDGRWIAHHGIPHTDALSAEHSGGSWVDAQWLAELAYYEAWRLGGYGLVAILTAVSIGSAYVVLAALIRSRGIPMGWTVAFTTLAMLGLVHWAFVRAQDLALPLFASLLAVCLTDSRHERPGTRLLLLPPLLALWANIHGSVLLGVAMVVAYLVWRSVVMAGHGSWRLAAGCAALALLSGLAPLATPYGVHIVDYYRLFNNPAQRVVSAEGRSPRFPGGTFFAVYVPLVLVAWLAIRANVARRPAPGLLMVACTLTAVAASMRIGNMVWHTMVTAMLIVELARTWIPARVPQPRLHAALALLGVTVVAAVVGGLAARSQDSYEADTALLATESAAASAAKHPCWLILADNLDASALHWHSRWLAGRIAFDARAELFPRQAMMRWALFQSARPKLWLSGATRYQLLIGNASTTPVLAQRLMRFPGGIVIARDRRGVAAINTAALRHGPLRCARPAGSRPR